MGKSEVFNDGRGEFWFRLKASNGETAASGESCETRRCLLRGGRDRTAEDVNIVDVK
jgi:Domain of unknown function (DUF1508)